jgi:hypothetical protein
MKKTLMFRAYYVIEMPDINESAPVYQDILKGKIEQALSEASDNYVMDLEDILNGSIYD